MNVSYMVLPDLRAREQLLVGFRYHKDTVSAVILMEFLLKLQGSFTLDFLLQVLS